MKDSKRNKINIIFSSFLVIGYIVCTYFFSTLASQVSGTLGSLIQILMLVVFGLMLFYATRVGEGRQVKRFSLAVLLLVVLPTLYIILASQIPALPFHDVINPPSVLGTFGTPSLILAMASIAFGYGIPYTFVSGYEMKDENEDIEKIPELEKEILEGGLAEELAEVEAEAKDEIIAETAQPVEAAEENTEITEEKED